METGFDPGMSRLGAILGHGVFDVERWHWETDRGWKGAGVPRVR
jgi:hypothetical protein